VEEWFKRRVKSPQPNTTQHRAQHNTTQHNITEHNTTQHKAENHTGITSGDFEVVWMNDDNHSKHGAKAHTGYNKAKERERRKRSDDKTQREHDIAIAYRGKRIS
jgi:hypothetical protein